MSVPREKNVDIFNKFEERNWMSADMPSIMPKAKTQAGPKLGL